MPCARPRIGICGRALAPRAVQFENPERLDFKHSRFFKGLDLKDSNFRRRILEIESKNFGHENFSSSKRRWQDPVSGRALAPRIGLGGRA